MACFRPVLRGVAFQKVSCKPLTIYMGGCQNCGPLLGPRNTRCRILLRIQKGTIILTITHMGRVEAPPCKATPGESPMSSTSRQAGSLAILKKTTWIMKPSSMVSTRAEVTTGPPRPSAGFFVRKSAYSSTVRFLFLAGLEGSRHHGWSEVFRRCSEREGPCKFPGELLELQQALYNKNLGFC